MSYREIIEIDEKAVPTIYHYCSSGAFLSIISNKKIWLSDINTMNDFGEMHWAYDRFMEAANNVINEIGESFISKVDEIISTSQQRVLPMLCSFSTDGDVLSQWRAYSENGKGVAIGFSTKELKKLGLKLGRVEYNRAAQVQHFSLFLRALHKVYTAIAQASIANRSRNVPICQAPSPHHRDMPDFVVRGYDDCWMCIETHDAPPIHFL